MKVALIKSYTDKPWRSPETYQMIENSLREKWNVSVINTDDPDIFHRHLHRLQEEYKHKLFAFNIAEYLDEENKAGFIPTLLKERRIAHLGSNPEAISLGLDKARTKRLLDEKQIPTPPYFVVRGENTKLARQAESIGYPLIVKPIEEGGHIGIHEDSVVHHDAALSRAVEYIHRHFDQPALVEKYITGDEMREFSVGIIGNGTRIFTPVEIDYDAMDVESKILSYEAAQQDLERIKLVEDEEIRSEIIDLAERTFDAVGASDYSRVDLRMNHTGCYVLEINTMPGLGPHSFLPEAAQDIHDLEYKALIQSLAEHSMKRLGI